VGLVALLVLVGVVEPELGCLVVLIGHPWMACTSGVGVLLVAVGFLVELRNLSLNADGFHNENTA